MCILANLGVTGVAGEPGPDAPSNVLLTVPEAVRFDPAVDAAMEGLAGKGLHWGFAPEGGTTGVVVTDIKGGEPREEEEGESGGRSSSSSGIEKMVDACEILLVEWVSNGGGL